MLVLWACGAGTHLEWGGFARLRQNEVLDGQVDEGVAVAADVPETPHQFVQLQAHQAGDRGGGGGDGGDDASGDSFTLWEDRGTFHRT